MKHAIPTLIALLASPALAEGTRELDAHEHGVGALYIAVDGKTVAMELHAPGADIVGFEYEATSAKDRAAIDAAVAILAKPLALFVLPAAAECSVTKASAGLESDDDHDDGDHDHSAHADGDEHDDHADDHGHDDHAAHDDHKDNDDHKDQDDHDDHAEASHTEFHAAYRLTCGNTDALTEIDFAYFSTFENARELEVQIISASGARAFEVERDMPKLDLRGMF